jgi:hypothetical protein
MGPAEYEARLGRLVECYRARMEQLDQPRLRAGKQRFPKIWDVLRAMGPLTAREACILGGAGDLPDGRYGPLLHHLEVNGWAAKHDQIWQVWNTRGHPVRHPVWRFVAAPDGSRARKRIALDEFNAAVARLELGRGTALCLTRRIAHGAKEQKWQHQGKTQRNQEIVRRRLAGESLSDLGAEHGISRERTRQIVERAVRR